MSDINRTYREIATRAKRHHAKKVLLFGSRARGTNAPKSDIDIAVQGCEDFDGLADELQEELWSLLQLDIINLDENISPELRYEIERDGVVLYEAL